MHSFISRLIAPVIAALVTWGATVGLDLGPDFAGAATEAGVLFVLALFTAIYGAAHKLIDRRVNPEDSAD